MASGARWGTFIIAVYMLLKSEEMDYNSILSHVLEFTMIAYRALS